MCEFHASNARFSIDGHGTTSLGGVYSSQPPSTFRVRRFLPGPRRLGAFAYLSLLVPCSIESRSPSPRCASCATTPLRLARSFRPHPPRPFLSYPYAYPYRSYRIRHGSVDLHRPRDLLAPVRSIGRHLPFAFGSEPDVSGSVHLRLHRSVPSWRRNSRRPWIGSPSRSDLLRGGSVNVRTRARIRRHVHVHVRAKKAKPTT